MPVYNAGDYLRESIESILNQTYPSFECICVDDCSDDDKTLELLDYYEKKDKRIIVKRLNCNVGAADARNYGFQYVTGEYTIFLDADDIFDECLLKTLYNTALDNASDVCVCSHSVLSDHSDEIIENVLLKEKNGVTDRVFSVKDLDEDGLYYWWGVPWNKLCRTDFLKTNNIYFQTLSSFNDGYYSVLCTLLANRIVYANPNKPLVYYRINNEKQISFNANIKNHYKYIKKVLDEYEEKLGVKEKQQIIYLLVEGGIYRIQKEKNEKKAKSLYDLIKKYLKENVDDSLLIGTSNRFLNLYRCWLENEFEDSDWFEIIDDYYMQIKKKKEELLANLGSVNSNIVVWGNGKRGKAIQQFLYEEGISNVIVTDSSPEKIRGNNEWGFSMRSVFLPTKDCTVIATNTLIYNELKRQFEKDKVKVINLQKYSEL